MDIESYEVIYKVQVDPSIRPLSAIRRGQVTPPAQPDLLHFFASNSRSIQLGRSGYERSETQHAQPNLQNRHFRSGTK